MRRYLAVAAVGIAALCLAWAGGRMTVPEILAKGDGPQGQGMKCVGAWFYHLYLGDSTTPTPLVGSINADGTTVTAGSPISNEWGVSSVSSAHGSWKCAGRNRIVGTFHCLGYNPDGTYGWYEKGPFEYTVSRDGDKLEGTIMIGNYTPDQEYGVDEPAYGLIPCTVVGWRIEAD
jgi:hypothetical protein